MYIKIEPEENSVWKEKSSERTFIPEIQKSLSSEDTGDSVLVKAESLPSCLEFKGTDNGVKKEEASDPSQEDGNGVTLQVTVHVGVDEFMAEEAEYRNAVVVKKEDEDLGDEGRGMSNFQLGSHQMQVLVGHPTSSAETSLLEDTSPSTSSSKLIENDDHRLQMNRLFQQLEGFTNEIQRKAGCSSPNERLQIGNMSQTGVKSFRCRFCYKFFTRKGHTKRHERTHTGEEPFQGEFWEKALSPKINCKTHEMIHTGEIKLKCHFCEKIFYSKSLRKSHEMTHTGMKPFKCQFCEKAFSQVGNCKSHEMIHTGQKPFNCQFCGKSFNQKRYCRRHEVKHTPENTFKCQFCEKIFIKERNFNVHKMTHTHDAKLLLAKKLRIDQV